MFSSIRLLILVTKEQVQKSLLYENYTNTKNISTESPESFSLNKELQYLNLHNYAYRAKNITNKPELNQKLTKKALLKEYTEEIERMRRDLQAARDKNGIFLDKENYNAMQSKLVLQEDQIKELEEKIGVMSLEAMKLNELFADTRKELEETAKNLELTTANLNATQIKLNRTTKERDEQTQLVNEHVKNEANLSSQGTKILQTADESTKDVQGLHAKLDRKREVEHKNTAIQKQFCFSCNQSIATMTEDLASFAEQHNQLNSSCYSSLGMLLKTRSLELGTLSKELSYVISVVTTGVYDMERAHGRHVRGMHKRLNKHIADCEGIRMICQQQVTRDFVINQMNYFTSQQMTTLESQVKQHEELAEAYSNLNKDLTEDVIRMAKNFQAAAEEQHLNVMTKMQQVEAKNTTRDYKSKTTVAFEESNLMLKKGCDALVATSVSNNTQSGDLIGKLMVKVGDCQGTMTGVIWSSQKFCEELNEIWKDHTNYNVDVLKNHKDLVEATLQTHAEGSQELSAVTVATIQDLDAKIMSDYAAFKKKLTAEQESLKQLDGCCTSWKERSGATQNKCMSAINQFLTKDLQKDVPTGTTPQRREFQYPRILTKTGNHNFGTKYFPDEAMNTALPYDSEHEDAMNPEKK